jgi:hypothetical protein
MAELYLRFPYVFMSDFSPLHSVQISSGSHPASYPVSMEKLSWE